MDPCSVNVKNILVLLVLSLLCTAQGKKPLADRELKCNSYADAKNREDHGSNPLSRSRESAFLLRIVQSVHVESDNFQYRGQSISGGDVGNGKTDSAFTF